MPREQINFPAPFQPTCGCDGVTQHCTDCPPPIHGEAWADPELSVSWTRANDHTHGLVQVSLLLPTGYVRHLVQSVDEGDAPKASGIGAFSPALGRDELNRMIRALRRARDQAFGADE